MQAFEAGGSGGMPEARLKGTLRVMFPNLPAVGVRDTSWVVGEGRTGGGDVGERGPAVGKEEAGAVIQPYILASLWARGAGGS